MKYLALIEPFHIDWHHCSNCRMGAWPSCLISTAQELHGCWEKSRIISFLSWEVRVHMRNSREGTGKDGVRITPSLFRPGCFKPAAWILLSNIAHEFLNTLRSSPFCYCTKSLAICPCPWLKLFPAHLSQMLHNRYYDFPYASKVLYDLQLKRSSFYTECKISFNIVKKLICEIGLKKTPFII